MTDDAPPPVKVDRRRGKRPPGTVVGTPFPKGKSPNPGGFVQHAPKLNKRQQALLQVIATQSPITVEEAIVAAGPAAVQLLVTVMTNTEESTRDRLYAAGKLIDKLKANAVAKSAEESNEEKQKVALEQFVEAMKAKPPGGGDAPS